MIPWRDIIEFERNAPDADARPRAIRDRFGVSPARYHQELDRVLDLPYVQMAAPDVVGRIKRRRDRHQTLRFARRIGQRLALEERGGPVAGQEALPLAGGAPRLPTPEEVMGKLGSALGEAARDLGMARVEAAVSPEWKDRRDFVIRLLAVRGEEFTAEDVRRLAGDPPGHPNAMGPGLATASRAGLIKKVGYRPSDRPTLHRHPIAVWIGTNPTTSALPSPEGRQSA